MLKFELNLRESFLHLNVSYPYEKRALKERRMVKNCDLGHSFSQYGPPSRQITYIYGAEFQWFTTFGLYYKEILIVCDFIKHFTL